VRPGQEINGSIWITGIRNPKSNQSLLSSPLLTHASFFLRSAVSSFIFLKKNCVNGYRLGLTCAGEYKRIFCSEMNG